MGKKMMKTLMICVAMIMASIFSMAGTAQSKAINLKYAGLLPPGTTLSAPVDEWGKLVEERTKGQVTLTTYHAQSLGKFTEFPKLMKSGLCDMAFVGGPSPGFDLIGVAELPPLVSSMRVSMDMLHALYRKGIFQPMFEDNGFKLMFFMNSDPRMAWFANKRVSTLSDLKGLKIRGTTPVHIQVLKSLGATAVAISPADVYMALERGTVDGVMNPTEGVFALKLFESLKYCLWEPLTSDMTAVVMNLKVWNSLPAEARVVIQDVNEEMKYRYMEYYKTEKQDIERIEKAGIEISRSFI